MLSFWSRYTMDNVFDEPDGWEIQNMLLIGALITRAAHWRAETRGVHSRIDAPEPSDEFLVHARWRRGDGEPERHPLDPAPAEATA